MFALCLSFVHSTSKTVNRLLFLFHKIYSTQSHLQRRTVSKALLPFVHQHTSVLKPLYHSSIQISIPDTKQYHSLLLKTRSRCVIIIRRPQCRNRHRPKIKTRQATELQAQDTLENQKLLTRGKTCTRSKK